MLQITIVNRLLPQKGNMPDCSHLGKRVKSATCADGCVTAASAANRQAKSRGRTIRLRCNPSFPTPFPTKVGSRADSPTLRLSPMRLTCRSLSPRHRPAVGKNRLRSSGAIEAGVAVVAVVAAGRKRHRSLRRFPGRAARPEKPPRPKPQARRPSPQGSRRNRYSLPGSQRAQWSFL